jgi:hypothetical protein
MPFSLANALATFWNYIYQVLGGLLDEFNIAYLDNILIFSLNYKTYIEYIRKVLE